LRQLREIVAVIKQYIRDYLDDIFEFIKDYWQSPLVDNIIGLIEEISLALNNEFKVYLNNTNATYMAYQIWCRCISPI